MKPRLSFGPLLLCVCTLVFAGFPMAHADQYKANNNDNLESGASWASDTAPQGSDRAIWSALVATAGNCTNTLGAVTTWGALVVSNPAAPVSINGNTTLTLSNGIDLGHGTVNLTLDCGNIDLGGNQIWTVASAHALTTGAPGHAGSVNSPNNGNFLVTLNGGGVWTTSGTGDNGSTGMVVNQGTLNLNKTSNRGNHAVGGPGLVVNHSATARLTGTGGDQIYDGASVTVAAGGLFDLYGNGETIANLYGNGVVDNTAPGTLAALTLGNGACTFSGNLQNSGSGAGLVLIKAGTGTLTLIGSNTYSGGTVISGSGTISLATTANAAMAYTNLAGTLSITAAANVTLPMTVLAFGNGSPELAFDLNGRRNLIAPLVNVAGDVILTANVAVNVNHVVQSGTNILLQYSGTRRGSGGFVTGSVPAGLTIVDDLANQRVISVYVSPSEPHLVIPTLNSNEIIVALATPQQYGAVGDGITDDSGAFQAAMDAVYNSGGAGGGVVFVPVGNYAFHGSLTIPTGVTLHGDWQDWTRTGGPLVGTTFKIYFGAGQSNGTPFITLKHSTALRDVNIWYPDQNATNITPYPFSIQVGNDAVVANVALVNAYQGITGGGDKNILRTVVGSPLALGMQMDQIFDVCHAEDIRFSPDLWPQSGVTNSPAVGGPHAAWMRANGTGMRLLRVDGEMCMDTFISGYQVGIATLSATNGQPGVTFYHGEVTNCAVALLAQNMPGAFGVMFACFTLDGDTAISRTDSTTDANAQFYGCTIIGREGPAAQVTGSDWHSWMQFQNCTISNALVLGGPGVFNVVNSVLLGTTQCMLNASATRAAFTGCTFAPGTNLVNLGNASNLLVNAQAPIVAPPPEVQWTNVFADDLSRRPTTTNLWVATDVTYGAYGDGQHDDTASIQSALAAAGANGGGLVYLPAGKYKLTGSLDVPSGVELRGAFEMRHRTQAADDGFAKGTILQPYGGQGTTDGPPAIALEAGGGVTGMTASYETQHTNCIPFPPLIQGRGPNIYIRAICCPNPYAYVDLATYSCTNHFLDMVDGWALKSGYRVGNGSSGTILDCHDNWTYWVDNGGSQSTLPGSVQAPVLSFASHNLEMYVLGNCRELMVKDFSIIEKTYLHAVDEDGQGPHATLINNYCDTSIQGFNLDAAAPAATLIAINMPMTTFNFGDFGDQAKATVAVMSTTNFQGTAQFLSSILWGGTWLDFDINGGDVSCDVVHMDNHSFIGSVVNGGVFRLVNNSAYITYNGASNYPPYHVEFGPAAGAAGKRCEFSASFSLNGCGLFNLASNNPVDCWNDYGLQSYGVLDPTAPVIYGVYPDGSRLYQQTNVLRFQALSPAAFEPARLSLTVDGQAETNLTVSGPATSPMVTFPGLTVNRPHAAVISATDNSGRSAAMAVSFDTFDPGSYTFEAEDFDYGNGQFFNPPQQGDYANLAGVEGVDLHCVDAGQGDDAYRPNPPGLETELATDAARQVVEPGVTDYDVGYNDGGNWANYTRTYPAGVYHVYLRGANGIAGTADSANLELVTVGQGTTNQTTRRLGTFSAPATGDWQSYTWVPLADAAGNPVAVTNSGATSTFRVTTDNGSYNANFYLLAPVYTPPAAPPLSGTSTATGLALEYPTLPGYSYMLEYKTNLTDATWLPLGSALAGNGSRQTVEPPAAGSRFYRLRIQ